MAQVPYKKGHANQTVSTSFRIFARFEQWKIRGHRFQRQEDTIRQFAGENGYALNETFRDAFSGTEADRPEFNRMIATILGNGVHTILVESLDRLARDVMVQSLLLAKLAQHGITLINCVTGEDVTASMSEDPMRKALIQIQSVFSELETSRLFRNCAGRGKRRRSRLANARAGRHSGKSRESEKAIEIMLSLRRKRSGKRTSFARIAEELNRLNVPSRTGAKWQTTTVVNILKRRAR